MPARGTLPGRDHEVTFASAPAAGTIAVTVMRTLPRRVVARSQADSSAVGGRDLENVFQAQGLLPGRERGPGAGAGDAAGQASAGLADGPRDQREAGMGVQDGGQFAVGVPLPPVPVGLRDPAAGHHDTSRPVNQPTFSSAARASSAVRWPYIADVMVTDE